MALAFQTGRHWRQPTLNPEPKPGRRSPRERPEIKQAVLTPPISAHWNAAHRLSVLWAATTAAIPDHGPRAYIGRAHFLASAIRHKQQIRAVVAGSLRSPPLARALAVRPHQFVGISHWPYMSSLWSVSQRFSCQRNHYDEIARWPALQSVGVDRPAVIATLGEVGEDARIVVDCPAWFMREGEITANLFLGELRAYSLSFSFDRADGQRVLRVGCIQGSNREDALDIYRALTKKLHGLRPRDLIVQVAQAIASAAGIDELHTITQHARIHAHPYFVGRGNRPSLATNYDQIWMEHGAVAGADGFFRLSSRARRRPLDEIDSGKRAMYRRRYALLDRLDQDIRSWMSGNAANA